MTPDDDDPLSMSTGKMMAAAVIYVFAMATLVLLARVALGIFR